MEQLSVRVWPAKPPLHTSTTGSTRSLPQLWKREAESLPPSPSSRPSVVTRATALCSQGRGQRDQSSSCADRVCKLWRGGGDQGGIPADRTLRWKSPGVDQSPPVPVPTLFAVVATRPFHSFVCRLLLCKSTLLSAAPLAINKAEHRLTYSPSISLMNR